MAKKEKKEKNIISKEAIEAYANELNGPEGWKKLNRTILSLDWMDNYVMYFHPEELDDYLEKCFKIDKTTRKDGKEVADVEKVRDYFLERYFPNCTKKAIEKAKAAEKARREEEKQAREAEKNLSPIEKRKLKLQRMAKKAEEEAEKARKAQEEAKEEGKE